MKKRPLTERIDEYLLAHGMGEYIPIHPDDVEEALLKSNVHRYAVPYRALASTVKFGGPKPLQDGNG